MYYEVWKHDGRLDVLSAEFLYEAEAIAWADDLERRGWHDINVYEVKR